MGFEGEINSPQTWRELREVAKLIAPFGDFSSRKNGDNSPQSEINSRIARKMGKR
jgi:hypothetical protein